MRGRVWKKALLEALVTPFGSFTFTHPAGEIICFILSTFVPPLGTFLPSGFALYFSLCFLRVISSIFSCLSKSVPPAYYVKRQPIAQAGLRSFLFSCSRSFSRFVSVPRLPFPVYAIVWVVDSSFRRPSSLDPFPRTAVEYFSSQAPTLSPLDSDFQSRKRSPGLKRTDTSFF